VEGGGEAVVGGDKGVRGVNSRRKVLGGVKVLEKRIGGGK